MSTVRQGLFYCWANPIALAAAMKESANRITSARIVFLDITCPPLFMLRPSWQRFICVPSQTPWSPIY
jgi:hypothetical protein